MLQCGWYWGPMSSESAEKLLANEKDGSFIVRDSSDDRYIFSLTFRLNSSIMHVRIEHGQGKMVAYFSTRQPNEKNNAKILTSVYPRR